jgi:hypothetical protein
MDLDAIVHSLDSAIRRLEKIRALLTDLQLHLSAECHPASAGQ